MERSCLQASSFLRIDCPRCGRSEVDDYEVVEPGIARVMCCDGCRGSFTFAVFECQRCEAESSFSWTQLPAAEQIRGLSCLACGERYEEVHLSSDGSGLVA